MNDAIAKVTPNDLDLLFQDKIFLNFNISKTVSASITCEMTVNTWRF